MSPARRSFVALAMLLAALPACRTDSTGPSPALFAGTYVLTSVSGRGPAAGTLTLSATGAAVRRVRYQQRDGKLSPTYVARGTFRPRADGTVDLRLRADDGRAPDVWRPLARITDGVLRLRHPDPADGPDIMETYRRGSGAARR
ncbi:MAG TPA: hypothetical protein VF041_19670 [Gemmatimonadaceae bacterium]